MQPHWQHDINTTLGCDYRWTSYAQGSSNTLYLGFKTPDRDEHTSHDDSEDDCIVLRRNAPAGRTPGVDRQREATILNIIAGQDWAPEILHNAPEHGWCAMTHYQTFPTNHPLTPAQQNRLIAAVSQLQTLETHSLSPTQNTLLTINYEALWAQRYRPTAIANNDHTALEWITQINQRMTNLPTSLNCLVHHDLHMGNLAQCKHTEQLIILDWEYAAIGNPWLDAANLSDAFHIAPHDLAQLPALQHLDASTFQTGLEQAIEITALINKLWYRARGEHPEKPGQTSAKE